MTAAEARPRSDRLDALRGVAIVWMAAFHFGFDLNHFGWICQDFYRDPVWTWQRTAIVSLFLFCAGGGQALAVRAGQGAGRFWKRWAQIAIDRNWGATMVLTEPDAGSDVGAGRAKAFDNGDGTWRIEGVKRFITNGEQDMTENIFHLVLARPEGAGPGTKGLSMFFVSKYHFDPETGEWLEGYDKQRELWESQYAAARERWEAHTKQVQTSRAADAVAAAEAPATGNVSTSTPAPAKAAEEPSGTLATDEALAALREKLAGGGN